MQAMIVRRLALLVLILFAVSILTFLIVNVLPGDVVSAILGDMATPEQVAAVRETMGLNTPLIERYFVWVGGILRGDLGTSLSFGVPIAPIVFDRLGNSAILAGLLLVIVIPLAIALGVISALMQGSLLDRMISAVSVVGYALPEFVVGITFILLFSILWPVLPGSSLMPEGANPLSQPLALVLPIGVLVLHQLAQLAQITRVSMIGILNSNFVRTATLKGLPMHTVVLRHALPNALPPVIAEIGMNFGYVLGGLVVVETLFSYPGIGQLMVMSVQSRDVPMLESAVLLIAAAYGLGNLFADIAALTLNPRLRDPR